MAVYTEVPEDELHRLLSHYDIGAALSFKGIAEGVENSNFLLQTEQGHFILTLYEKRVRAEDLPYFMALLGHLVSKGVPCAPPVPARDGSVLHMVCGRHAAIMKFLPGLSPRRPDASQCGALGTALARLHLAGQDFHLRRENSLGRHAWGALFKSCEPKANQVQMGLSALLAQELRFHEGHWPQHLAQGQIHADLFPDNVFFRDGVLTGLIDFYFACTDILAYDVAVCLNAWCFEADGSFNLTKGRALLSRYAQVRALDTEEVRALPVLARGAAMRFLLTRLYDWLHQSPGALVKPKDPREYLSRLRFHQTVAGPSDYGWVG